MNVGFDFTNNKLIIRIDGDIDHHTCEEIRNKIDNEIGRRNPKSIIFDMKNVNFMDSSGIGVIIGRYRKVSEYGGKVAITNLKPQIKKVFELGGLFRIIKEFSSADEAAASM